MITHDARVTTTMSAWRFKAGPDEAIEFHEGLEADNPRYWQAHKPTYDLPPRQGPDGGPPCGTG